MKLSKPTGISPKGFTGTSTVALCAIVILSLAPALLAGSRSARDSRLDFEISRRCSFTDSATMIVFKVDPDLSGPGVLEVTCVTRSTFSDSAIARAHLRLPRDLRNDADKLTRSFALENRNPTAEENEAVFAFGGAVELFDRDLRERIRYRVELQVPVGLKLRIEAPSFDVDIEGAIGGLLIERTLAPVNVRGARGMLVISGANARINVSDLIGEYEIKTTNERIRLTDVTVVPHKASEPVTAIAETENANIELTRYRGIADLETTRGAIRGRDVAILDGVTRLVNEGGEIDVRFAELAPDARLTVNASYEGIQLAFTEDVNARFSLSAEDGGMIDIDGLPHRIPAVFEERLKALCGDGSAEVKVSARHGSDIYIVRAGN